MHPRRPRHQLAGGRPRRRAHDRLRPALDPRRRPLARARSTRPPAHELVGDTPSPGPRRRGGAAPRDVRPRRLPDARHDRSRRRHRRRRRAAVARLRRAALVHGRGSRDERRRPRADLELPRGDVRDHHVHRQQAPGRGLQAHRLHPQQRARATNKEPSFTIIYSRCVHLGCPVQPNGPQFEDKVVEVQGRHADARCSPPASAAPATAAPTTPRATAPPARPFARSTATPSRSSTATSSSASTSASARSRARARTRRISRYRQAYPGRARRRHRALALSHTGAGVLTMAKSARQAQIEKAALYPLDWVEERTGLVGDIEVVPVPERPARRQLDADARGGDADGVPRAGDDRRLPRDVLQARPEQRLRVDPEHHERGHARLARPRHAQVGREPLHHPDVPPHGAARSCSAPTSTRASSTGSSACCCS